MASAEELQSVYMRYCTRFGRRDNAELYAVFARLLSPYSIDSILWAFDLLSAECTSAPPISEFADRVAVHARYKLKANSSTLSVDSPMKMFRESDTGGSWEECELGYWDLPEGYIWRVNRLGYRFLCPAGVTEYEEMLSRFRDKRLLGR